MSECFRRFQNVLECSCEVSKGPIRFQKVPEGSRRFQKVPEGSRRF